MRRSLSPCRPTRRPHTREPGDRRRPGDHSPLEWRPLGAPLRPTDRDRPELYRCRLFVQSRDGSEPPKKPDKTETSPFPKTGGYILPAGVLQPGWYWKVVGKTMALKTKASPVWASQPPVARHHRTTTPPAAGEIVLYAANATSTTSGWKVEADTSAANHLKLRHADAKAAKLSAPGQPTHYFELTFNAEAGRPYHLWLRGRADTSPSLRITTTRCSSVLDGITQDGADTWQIGSPSATDVNLEDCSGCGQSGWGWQDNGWGSATAIGTHVYFRNPGRIRSESRRERMDSRLIRSCCRPQRMTTPGPRATTRRF